MTYHLLDKAELLSIGYAEDVKIKNLIDTWRQYLKDL